MKEALWVYRRAAKAAKGRGDCGVWETHAMLARMQSDSDEKPVDWRTRFHSLPSGTEDEPVPLWSAAIWAFIRGGVLFLFGALSIVIFGPFIGLSIGVGPEDTGGTFYLICGVPVNFCIGGLIAGLRLKCFRRRSGVRFTFYSFTAPSFLIFFYLLYSFVTQFLSR